MCALAIATLAPPTEAQPTAGGNDERAAAAFEQGVARFRIGDYAAALVAFRDAYRLAPNPAVLYNVGQTYEALGRHGPAYQALERYVSESTGLPPARRAEVLRTLRRLRPLVAAVTLDLSPRDAAVSTDGGEAEPLPPGGVVYLEPGPHQLEARAEGRIAASAMTTVNAGETSTLRMELAPTPPPPPAPVEPNVPPPAAPSPRVPAATAPPRQARGLPAISLALGGVALAAFATTAVSGIIALGAQSEVDDASAAVDRGESVSARDVRSAAHRGRTAAVVADAALATGIVSAGIAVAAALVSSGAHDRPPSVAVAAGPRGVALVGQF